MSAKRIVSGKSGLGDGNSWENTRSNQAGGEEKGGLDSRSLDKQQGGR